MRRFKNLKDCSYCVLLAIVSFFLIADLFINTGRPIAFDSQIHITTMTQFASALRDGEFPVRWANGFANYGLPLALFAHQTTNYLGAILILLTNQVILSYNVVLLAGAVLSTVLCYRFLRFYFSEEAALAGSFLFNFAPYRISNIYIRGALPEFWASVFVFVVMIGFYILLHQKKWQGWIISTLGLTLLVLTHPMMFLITSVVFLPYAALLLLPTLNTWLLKKDRKQTFILCKNILLLGSSIVIAFLMSAYYLLPLTLEIKYFYHGLDQRHFASGNFLGLRSYVLPEHWSFFSATEIGPRGLFFTLGSIEIVFVAAGIVAALAICFFWMRKQKKTFAHIPFLYYSLVVLLLSIFFTLPQ
jgi:hypothetical protein